MTQHTGGRIDFTQHQRFPWACNAGFFLAYRFTVLTQPVGVVDVDSGNDRDIRIDDIDSVEATTEPDFQHHQIES